MTGNTQEYILSDAVAYIAERSDPAKIAIRTGRLDIISAAQQSDPALRIHYAAKHCSRSSRRRTTGCSKWSSLRSAPSG